MRRSCLDCEYFDKEHYDMYEEAICTKADETIRLRRGQHHPRWCPDIQTQVAYQHMLQDISVPSGTDLSGTYIYGGWMPAPQVCCTSGPEKTNCKNCGASLRGHYRCEYCGTVNN